MRTGEAAHWLGVSQDTVIRYFDEGKLDGRRSEGGHRYVLINAKAYRLRKRFAERADRLRPLR